MRNYDFEQEAFNHARDFEAVYEMYDDNFYKVNDNPTIWRYMDLVKLNSLLHEKAMFFAKPSVFTDPLEGSYSKWEVDDIKDSIESTFMNTRDYMKKVQEFSAVSCWHMNEYESAGMWDLYLKSNDGVAIKSDFASAINSLEDIRYRIFAGKVQYIDYNKDITSQKIFDTLFFKRKSFQHENELRFMIVASRIAEDFLSPKYQDRLLSQEEAQDVINDAIDGSYDFISKYGQLVKCDPQKLIKKIYVSPKSSQQYVNMVKQIIKSHGFSENLVVQSDLYDDYIY